MSALAPLISPIGLNKMNGFLRFSEITQFPFVEKSFPVTLMLVDEEDNLKPWDAIRVRLRLVLDDKNRSDYSSDLELVHSNADIPSGSSSSADSSGCVVTLLSPGPSTFHVRINRLSMQAHGCKFLILAEPETPHLHPSIGAGVSDPLLVVKYRLMVVNDASFDCVWFKDQPNQNKYRDLHIHLFDANEEIKTFERRVPLVVTLLYDNYQEVEKVGTGGNAEHVPLKLRDSRHPLVLGRNASTVAGVRIEAISKNHQGRLFVVKVAPDTRTTPANADIAPFFCLPVEVKTKQHDKRVKEAALSGMGGYAVPPAAASGGVGAGSLLHSPFYPSPVTMGSRSTAPAFGSVKVSHRLNDADVFFETVLSWAEYVVHSMAEHQWKVVGYDPDDGDRPLYEMRNPNAFYDEATKKYHNVVIPSMQYVREQLAASKSSNGMGGDTETSDSQHHHLSGGGIGMKINSGGYSMNTASGTSNTDALQLPTLASAGLLPQQKRSHADIDISNGREEVTQQPPSARLRSS